VLFALASESRDTLTIWRLNLKSRTSNTRQSVHEISLMVEVVRGLGVDVVDDHGIGKRGNDEQMELPRGYRHHHQHEQYVRDIGVDVHYDVGVDAEIDSSVIGGNVWVEKMVTGVQL